MDEEEEEEEEKKKKKKKNYLSSICKHFNKIEIVTEFVAKQYTVQ